MSGILEALDMMYEVKGEAELASYKKRRYDDFKAGNIQQNRQVHKPAYDNIDRNVHDKHRLISSEKPMRTADDYRNRTNRVGRALDTERSRQSGNMQMRKDRKAKNECTETIDTLEGIL